MKKYLLYNLAAVSLLFTATSCGNDFLTVEPQATLPTDGYYTTEATILQSAIAAYGPMAWFDYANGQFSPLHSVSDMQSDDIYTGGADESDCYYMHVIGEYRSDGNNTVDQDYGAAYSGVNRSIHLIDNASNPDAQLTDAQRTSFIAEGHVLRNYYYSILWKNWGNVPYYEENLGPETNYLCPQMSADSVYLNVIADLETTIDGNALPMKQTDASLDGRITNAAAMMIYTDMVMYQKDQSRYAKALGYMKEIINSGQYSLVANYADLFEQPTEWSNEIIMDVNYKSQGGLKDWGNYTASGGTVFPTWIGIDGLTYKLGTDPAYEHVQDYVGGWGASPVAKEAYDAFDPTDARRDISILNMSQYMKDKLALGDTVYYTGRFQNTGFFLRKYLGRVGGNEGAAASTDMNYGNNFHIYRYAETLLNAAELALASGDAGTALTYVNQVRARAGLAALATVTEEAILQERHVEFVGEGKRYYDLVRTGTAAQVLVAGGGVLLAGTAVETKETLAAHGITDDNLVGKHMAWTPLVYTNKGTALPLRVQWTESKKYLPIPQSIIDNTSGAPAEYVVTQNPY